jgi:hypothetical protein
VQEARPAYPELVQAWDAAFDNLPK